MDSVVSIIDDTRNEKILTGFCKVSEQAAESKWEMLFPSDRLKFHKLRNGPVIKSRWLKISQFKHTPIKMPCLQRTTPEVRQVTT